MSQPRDKSGRFVKSKATLPAADLNEPETTADAQLEPADEQDVQPSSTDDVQPTNNVVDNLLNNLTNNASNNLTDNYSNGNNMSLNLLPTPFNGSVIDNAEDWLESVENYAHFQKMNDESKTGLFCLLLRQHSKIWFQKLDATSKATWAALRAAFLAQFSVQSQSLWQTTAKVWETKQEPNQTVEEYLLLLQERAAKAEITDKQVLYSAINGLSDKLRPLILQQNPQNLTELRKWAMLAESSMKPADDKIVESIQRLEAKFTELATMQTQHMHAMSNTGTQYYAGPSISELNAQANKFTPAATYEYRQQQPAGRYNNPPMQKFTSPSYESQTQQRKSQTNGERPPRKEWSNSGYQSERYTSQQSERREHTFDCSRCGYKHTNPKHCKASDAECHFCHKIGHFKAVCRAAKRKR